MHVDEFIFNCCVSSMLSDDTPESSAESSAMNVFSIDENKIRDANGIIFAEAITCYKCTFCGKMFAAMEVVLTHYQSNHRSSVIPLLGAGILFFFYVQNPNDQIKSKASPPKPKPVPIRPVGNRKLSSKAFPYGPIKSRTNVLSESTNESMVTKTISSPVKSKPNKKYKCLNPGCNKAFTYKLGLENHQKSHKKLKSYKCNWNDCKFKCSDLAGLRFHKNTHSGDNPFKCVWPGCSQSFPDAAAKETHLQTEHIKDAILECEYPNCGAKFLTSSERERHNAVHITKKARFSKVSVFNTLQRPQSMPKSQGKPRGRPPGKRKAPVVELGSSSSDDESDSSEPESSDDDIDEDHENQVIEEETHKDLAISKIESQNDSDSKNSNEPLDLSKTALDLTKEKMCENKTPTKRGRKRKKSSDKSLNKSIAKTVFRCDYPGCRKTFADSELLHEHEKENHKNLSSESRSRYERRCKGNLYYKI